MHRIPSETVQTFDLDHEQLLVLTGRRGARVRVLAGGVWLTEESQQADRFARPGGELLLGERGRAVLEGLGPTRIEVAEPVRHGPLRDVPTTLRSRTGARLVRLGAAVASLVLAVGLADGVARGFHQTLNGHAPERSLAGSTRAAVG